MKRLILLSASIILLLSACEKKEELAYVPSKFPTETKLKKDYSFKIPYEKEADGNIYGVVKIGKTPVRGAFDTGCGFSIHISLSEALQMKKNGMMFIGKEEKVNTVLADGTIQENTIWTVSDVSITDAEGQEHVFKNVDMVIVPNVEATVLFGLPLLQALGSSFEISDSESAILIRE